MKTGSRRSLPRSPDWTGPLYLDASALVKIYMPEPGSDELDAALQGRDDLVISDLAVTEVISALTRRRREGGFVTTVYISGRLVIMSDFAFTMTGVVFRWISRYGMNKCLVSSRLRAKADEAFGDKCPLPGFKVSKIVHRLTLSSHGQCLRIEDRHPGISLNWQNGIGRPTAIDRQIQCRIEYSIQ